MQTPPQEIAFPVEKGAGVGDEARHRLPVGPEKADRLLGQAVDAPGLHVAAETVDHGRIGHQESGPQARHAEDLRHRPEHNNIVETAGAHAVVAIRRHKGQVGFVDDEADLRMGAAEVEETGMGNQLAGGIVGIADKHRVVAGKRRFQPFQVGGKAVGRSGQEKIGLDIVHPAAVGIVGIGRADDQHPPGGQGSAGGIDELGGAAAGQDPLRRNAEQGGNGLNRGAAIDLGQNPDPVQPLFEMVDQSGQGAERIDVAAHVDDLLRPAAHLLGHGEDVAPVPLDHRILSRNACGSRAVMASISRCWAACSANCS